MIFLLFNFVEMETSMSKYDTMKIEDYEIGKNDSFDEDTFFSPYNIEDEDTTNYDNLFSDL